MKHFAAVAILIAPIMCQAQGWEPQSCGVALEGAYKLFAVRVGAATSGDFNADHQADFAFLLDKRTDDDASAIGVCLSGEPRPLLITSPYASTRIFTKPEGTVYMDFTTEKSGIYERDVISVSDGWIGASYVLRAGVFVKVIDGD